MAAPTLYIGVCNVKDTSEVGRAMVSLNRLEQRKADFRPNAWILDSGAFTRITSGRGHIPVAEYAAHIRRWAACGELQAAVCQDWMCEPFVTALTGETVREHQSMTTANYQRLMDMDTGGVYIMPVIQGFTPAEYGEHLDSLSPMLAEGAWVGVGSVCKRQGSPSQISAVLTAILHRRPDLRLHGFGVKSTALRCADIAGRFYSVDSMAWSFAGRMAGTGAHNIKHAIAWAESLESIRPAESQISLPI